MACLAEALPVLRGTSIIGRRCQSRGKKPATRTVPFWPSPTESLYVPASVTVRNAAILLCIRRRDFRQAAWLAEQARSLGVADACTFGMKGHALSSLGHHDEAALAYQDALKLGPEDPYVRHLAASSGGGPDSKRAPEEYIRTVFDGYADRFESHLISLGYGIPGAI